MLNNNRHVFTTHAQDLDEFKALKIGLGLLYARNNAHKLSYSEWFFNRSAQKPAQFLCTFYSHTLFNVQ